MLEIMQGQVAVAAALSSAWMRPSAGILHLHLRPSSMRLAASPTPGAAAAHRPSKEVMARARVPCLYRSSSPPADGAGEVQHRGPSRRLHLSLTKAASDTEATEWVGEKMKIERQK